MQLTQILTVAFAAVVIASPAPLEARNNGGKANSKYPKHTTPFKPWNCSPKKPHKQPPPPTPKTQTCYVDSHGDSTKDDSDFVVQAIDDCNNGGHVVFQQGLNYTIGTALNLTYLNNIDIDIQGTIKFTNDTTYWQANSFKFIFQNVTSFWQFGGKDVSIYGGGTIDGNGQTWYDLYAKNIYILRPTLIGVLGLVDSSFSNLNLRYSPTYYYFVANSSNVLFDNLNIAGGSTSTNVAKNTDGWDTYRSTDITIQNSYINNGDDCVSFKPNSTNVLVQNLDCIGSHGISVGSLGQYLGEYDIVQNIYVYNISLHNTSDGARIKVWPNTPSALSGDLQGGGGAGMVKNITYDTLYIDNVDYAIEVDQCYGQSNLTLCNQFPSAVTISDVIFNNFIGKTSKKYQPEIATFACSSSTVCNNIMATKINVLSPNGTRNAYCQNVNAATLDVNCTTQYLGFN